MVNDGKVVVQFWLTMFVCCCLAGLGCAVGGSGKGGRLPGNIYIYYIFIYIYINETHICWYPFQGACGFPPSW